MDRQTRATLNDMGPFAEDARALMTATTDMAAEKLAEARQHVVATVGSAKETAGRVRDQAVDYAKAAAKAAHEHPYRAIGIALGVGALLGCFVLRWSLRNGDR